MFTLRLNYIGMGKFGFSFSLNRAIGITGTKQRFARKTGIPTSKQGIERRLGSTLINLVLKGLFSKK